MHPTKNDLSAKIRKGVIELLNARLADLIDLQLQTKQAHWNVKGPNFIALHELFDSIAGEILPYIDDTAERIVQLGGTADGTLGGVAKRTELKGYPVGAVSGEEHVEALSNALATVGKLIRESIDQADDLGDADTADLFTGISRGLDKSLWFVESHAIGKK
jgi:starvation-inducible DNA-binding protein